MSSDEDVKFDLMCETCTVRPAYRGHRYCSKICAGETPKIERKKKVVDEPTDEDEEDIASKMARMSVSAPKSTGLKARLCITCKLIPAVGGHQFCSKSCMEKPGNQEGSSRAGASSRQYIEEVEDSGDDWGGYEKRDKGRVRAQTEDDSDSDHEASKSTALTRRPSMCMYCRRNPKVGDSAFCGHRCMKDAMKQLGSKTVRNKRPRESRGHSYPDPMTGYGPPPVSPQWYTAGYVAPNYTGWAPPLSPYGANTSYPNPMPSYPPQQTFYNPSPWPAYPPVATGPPCAIPGCRMMAFSPTAKYCGQTCRKDAVTRGLETGCLFCKIYPKSFKKHFCSQKCGQTAEAQGPMLLDVPQSDPKYADIVKQFNATWTGGYGAKTMAAFGAGRAAVANPTIKRICKVVNSKAVETRYQTYRKQIEAKWNFAAQGKPEGNECRRWHGTQRICTVGDTANNLNLCVNAACRLCSIIRVSFQTSSSVSQANGIYTSAFSGVSHGYTRLATVGSPHKAMFLTRIVVGKKHVGGYAPVAGTDSTAIDNIDSELIVFTNDAILPSWLVLYS